MKDRCLALGLKDGQDLDPKASGRVFQEHQNKYILS